METKRTLNNFVFIKLDSENASIKLKSGFELYVDRSFNPEKHAQVVGQVYGLPSHLQYTGQPNRGMPWLTDMEIRMGDKVILYYLSVINALKKENSRFIIEGEDKYIFVPYNTVYAIVRGEEIIPVNGYALIEPVENPDITRTRERVKALGMEYVETGRKISNEVTFGKIKYLGTANREYVDENQSDRGVDVAVGDTVVIRKTADVPLQYDLHQKVNQGVKLFRVQRRNIMAKV
jgi:co-chaperonin GroES (HSP10)